jgi:ubiquitin carboxyl-terminal hydrolase 9/24
LEKRVKGITEIRDMIEKLDSGNFNFQNKAKLITKEFMIKWIRENGILELLLLGDSIHPELVKRCTDIAVFLTKSNSFNSIAY